MKDAAEQLSLFGPDGCVGKTFQVSFPAAPRKGRIFGSSSRRSLELKYVAYQSLDLTPGHGSLLGESYWELRSPWRGGASPLNTGVSPREERGCSLSQILQDSPHRKYYLSRKACLGILRRAKERGKELPPQLKWALEVQAGLRPYCPNGTTEVKAYHINQRDEGIDLNGVSGALMTGSNLQMQTFVTGEPVAFAANQRDEVRDLHDLAGAVTAQPGMKQQTFIAEGCPSRNSGGPLFAAAFSAGAGAKAGGISYSEDCAPTLKGSPGGNLMPSVLCLNDQGGGIMDCSEDLTGTLRAQEHGHQPLLFENYGIDSRYTGPHEVAPTMTSRYGSGFSEPCNDDIDLHD